jgi:hypothetical protein
MARRRLASRRLPARAWIGRGGAHSNIARGRSASRAHPAPSETGVRLSRRSGETNSPTERKRAASLASSAGELPSSGRLGAEAARPLAGVGRVTNED